MIVDISDHVGVNKKSTRTRLKAFEMLGMTQHDEYFMYTEEEEFKGVVN